MYCTCSPLRVTMATGRHTATSTAAYAVFSPFLPVEYGKAGTPEREQCAVDPLGCRDRTHGAAQS